MCASFRQALGFGLVWFGLSISLVQAVPLSIKPNTVSYAGELRDSESQLQYLNARYYYPFLSRFITRDTEPLLNRFSYADGNPVMNEDPSGHLSEGATIGAIVGGSVAIVVVFIIAMCYYTNPATEDATVAADVDPETKPPLTKEAGVVQLSDQTKSYDTTVTAAPKPTPSSQPARSLSARPNRLYPERPTQIKTIQFNGRISFDYGDSQGNEFTVIINGEQYQFGGMRDWDQYLNDLKASDFESYKKAQGINAQVYGSARYAPPYREPSPYGNQDNSTEIAAYSSVTHNPEAPAPQQMGPEIDESPYG